MSYVEQLRRQKQLEHYQEDDPWGKEQADAWDKFMKLYVQDAMGHPTNIPDHYLNSN